MFSNASYDPAVHGEDRNPNADPAIVRNITKAFQNRKNEFLSQGGVIHKNLKKIREEESTKAKIDFLRKGLDEFQPDSVELMDEIGNPFLVGTTKIAQRRNMYSKPDKDLLEIIGEKLLDFKGGSKARTGSESRARNQARGVLKDAVEVHREYAVESMGDFGEAKAYMRAVGYLNADGSVNTAAFNAWRDASAQAEQADKARSESTQAQTEATQHSTAVIQTEIPLLHERRAALAGGSDQTRIATEAETAFTAARAQSVATQQAMVDGFMRSLTEQDAWLTGGSRNANSAAPGPSETSGSPTDSVAEERARFLAADPPPNLQEIYRDQLEQDHDMSGFLNAEHWWEKHKEHVAKLKYGYAQGTAFAPGGLALVGEMGPELVNLPRGSQVIPNPRLGGDVHVHVNVEGSVVAERDLAQRLRQELIRTSRRTVDLGFN